MANSYTRWTKEFGYMPFSSIEVRFGDETIEKKISCKSCYQLVDDYCIIDDRCINCIFKPCVGYIKMRRE